MFDFSIFQAGGLLLWPQTAKPTTVSVINEYIQRKILEGHKTSESLSVDKNFILVHHDAEHDIFFSVVLHIQIAQQITYLDQLLTRVQETFLFQYQAILDQTAHMRLPTMFVKFSTDEIVDDFRGQTAQSAPPPSNIPKTEASSRSESPEPTSGTNRKPSPGGGVRRGPGGRARTPSPKHKDNAPAASGPLRPRHTDQKTNESLEGSTVIRGDEPVNETVTVETYDLNDMKGIFLPAKQESRIGSIFKSILGEKILTAEVLQPVLEQFEQHLVNKNVAAHIAKNLTEAVGHKLENTKAGTFDSIKTLVTSALREQIERILTPHRSLDLIRDIQTSKAKGEPYSMAFVGVNGVGKSTNLAKVAYLFKSHGFKVLITACDTFRSGAIDQLRVHADRLDIYLFERGGSRRDPVPVAKESLKFAKEQGYDVVLIDTAGRMQNDDNLMKQIARLVNEVKPDLTVFVAEALVGNNGSDQIQSFDIALRRHAPGTHTQGIDGIVLTKFDTIDDKVGAALTMVFETGHPIVFLGVGQQYRDLRKMNPEFVVSTLLSGF